jgi:peptidoglycan hydrolase-like protein with peptidoglycan-binding domain
VISEFERACQASLERSRARRTAAAQRLTTLRRRRRRGSTGTVAMVTAVLALGAPLALGQTTAQAPVPQTLQPGASGSAVKALQSALGLKPTGRFTPAVTRAVKAFQRKNGLAVDGIVGPQTASALGLSSGLASAASTASTAAAPANASSTLERIARCESGGDPAAVSADGVYRGKYQFTRATWKAMGGTGDPAAAPESEQDQRAAALLAAQGTAPWPVCGGSA